jgi:hypothetical protein
VKEIKTKSTIKDIKALDKASDVSRKMKNAYIRTKDKAEQLGHNESGNYVDDAGNSVREGTETVARKAGHTLKNQGKNAVQKIRERRAPDKGTLRSDSLNGDYARQAPKSEAKETVHRNIARTETKQATARKTAPFKSKEAAKQNPIKPAAKQAVKRNAAQSGAKEAIKRKFTLSKPNELAKRRFVQSRAKQRFVQTGEIRAANLKVVQKQVQQVSGHITAQTVKPPLFQRVEKAAVRTLHTSGEAGRTIKQSAGAGGKIVKKTAKGRVKTVQKSVKTAEYSAKAGIKTSQAAAKTAAKTAQATAQAAQRTAQAARAATKAAAITAKTAVKALVAAIKAIIAAFKGLIALIAAGGWIALVVILVICLAGLLVGSVFGVFFSNESYDANTPIMTEVVSRLNEEFTAEIQRIQEENPHDTLEMSGNGSSTISNWREILAVYAVKAAADPENGMEVATLNDAKVGILRSIFWDMNKIDYWLETIEHVETVTSTDEDGNETTETITTTEIILHINMTSKSHTDMIAGYGFSSDQVKMLNELMKDEYQQLFIHLIGS